MVDEVAAWENSRNKKHVKANWQFTTADARVKLRRLYGLDPTVVSPGAMWLEAPPNPQKTYLSRNLGVARQDPSLRDSAIFHVA